MPTSESAWGKGAMLDAEAHVTLQVENLSAAVVSIRKQVADLNGQLVSDVMEDLATQLDDPAGIDLIATSLGTEFYSEMFGDGGHATLNPYLGFRAGYVRSNAVDEVAVGASIGLELYKAAALLVDLQLRSYALFGSGRGLHAVLAPALSVHTAF